MVKLTQEEEKAVVALMHVIWQEIGNDLLECSGGESLSGATLRDVVLDQIYNRMGLRDANIQYIKADWTIIRGKWDAITTTNKLRIAKKAFPARSYC